jgi:hypothetical protein
MNFRWTVAALCLALLTGCAAAVKKDSANAGSLEMPKKVISKLVLNVSGPKETTSAEDWNGFKQEWLEHFEEQAEEAHIAFEMQEGPPRATGEEGVLLYVFVQDYRFIRPGTRYIVGITAGNAFIESKLTLSDLQTGAPLGSQVANTASSAWEGIFSAMTNRQVEAIATDVFKQIKGKKD